jgi:hypothetical protein
VDVHPISCPITLLRELVRLATVATPSGAYLGYTTFAGTGRDADYFGNQPGCFIIFSQKLLFVCVQPKLAETRGVSLSALYKCSIPVPVLARNDWRKK